MTEQTFYIKISLESGAPQEAVEYEIDCGLDDLRTRIVEWAEEQGLLKGESSEPPNSAA